LSLKRSTIPQIYFVTLIQHELELAVQAVLDIDADADFTGTAWTQHWENDDEIKKSRKPRNAAASRPSQSHNFEIEESDSYMDLPSSDEDPKAPIPQTESLRDVYHVTPLQHLASLQKLHLGEDGNCMFYGLLAAYGLCDHASRRACNRTSPSARDLYLSQGIRDYLATEYGRKSSAGPEYDEGGILVTMGDYAGDFDDLKMISEAFGTAIVYWNEMQEWAYSNKLEKLSVFIGGEWTRKYATQIANMEEVINLVSVKDVEKHFAVCLHPDKTFLPPPAWLATLVQEFDA